MYCMKIQPVLITILLVSTIFFVSQPLVSADYPGFWEPLHGYGVIDGLRLNYSRCWNWVRQHLNYSLQYSRNGVNWYTTGGLQVVFHNLSEDSKKLTLIFNATQGNPRASYRLTCFMPDFVRNFFVFDREHTLVTLEYVLFGHPLAISFNYSDLLGQGLIFSWGNLSDMFWFRMQKNDLLNGRYVLDPKYLVNYSGESLATEMPNSNKIVRLQNGTLVACYRKKDTKDNIYLARSLDSGATWKVTKKLSNYATYDAGEPAIVVDSHDFVHVIWKNWTGAATCKMMYVNYTDSSNTTSSLSGICGDNYAVTATLALSGRCGLAIDSSNNLHAVWVQGASTSYILRYNKRTGTTWGLPVNKTAASSVTKDHPNVMIGPNNNVYIFFSGTYGGFTRNQIHLLRYWNGNATWSKITNITTITGLIQQRPCSAICRNGSIFLVWDGNPIIYSVSNLSIRYSISSDAGSTWNLPRNLTTDRSGANSAPSVVVSNGSTPTVHVVWMGRTTLGNTYIRYRNSTNFGTSWTAEPINLTDNLAAWGYPGMINSWNPNISGKHTNIPYRDYAFIATNGTTVYYYSSPSLSWAAPSGPPDVAPAFNSEDPINGSTVAGGSPYCSVYVYDVDNSSSMRICLYENSTGSWIKRYSVDTHLNGTHGFLYPYVHQNSRYWWKVSANDGTFNSTVVYWFRTANILPTITNPQPANGSTGRNVSSPDIWTNITVSEVDGETMNITWYSNATREFISHPNGVGNRTGLTPVGAASNWECVDDTTLINYPLLGKYFSNNATDYVHPNVFFAAQWDTYSMQDHTTEDFTIYNLTIYIVIYLGDDGTGQQDDAWITIRTYDTFYNYSVINPEYGVWIEKSKEFTLNPFTGAPWTWLEVDRLACGVKFKDDTGMGGGCTAVYLKVNPRWDLLHPHGWYRQYGFNGSVGNSTRRWNNSNFTDNCTRYYWYVTVGDGTGTNTSDIFHFDTWCPTAVSYIISMVVRRIWNPSVLFGLGGMMGVFVGWLFAWRRKKKRSL